ncbi:hypothetical protein CRENPOLYSF1_850016 [Crenothrix polyspora]|uniref:Uncharacterized protein n=1 Tax=Crenothrix polyspora TaxID=360316 RepID=A0A1R4HIP1_9GAMM|nr:hypothetical protein CRENPOLYSF1_850016 [Crenothrix polyspora]
MVVSNYVNDLTFLNKTGVELFSLDGYLVDLSSVLAGIF